MFYVYFLFFHAHVYTPVLAPEIHVFFYLCRGCALPHLLPCLCVSQVIISMQAHKLVKDHFSNIQLFPDNYCRIRKEQNYNPMRKQNKVNMLQQSLDDPLLEVKVKGYIPGAVLRNLRPDSPEDEHWSNEVRGDMCT